MTRRRELLAIGFALVIAYFALVIAFVFLFTLSKSTIKHDAARQATISRCIATRPLLLHFNHHLRLLDELLHVRPFKFHVPSVAECKNPDT